MDTNSFRDREETRQSRYKGFYDLTMGLIWFVAGIFFITAKYFGNGWGLDSLSTSLFGIAALCYGIFRLYRGYSTKKRK